MNALSNMMKNKAVASASGKGNGKGNGKTNGHTYKENATPVKGTMESPELSDQDFGKF